MSHGAVDVSLNALTFSTQDLLARNRELELACQAAEERARSQSAFLANMSHEIRTPMNGVIAMTDLLLQTQLNPQQRDCVETIRSSGESLITILNDILQISKLQAGKLELENQPFDLRKCLEDALDLLAPRFFQKKLELTYYIEPAVLTGVRGDAVRLRQIVVNLLGNAVKFTERGEVFLDVKLADPRDVCAHDFHEQSSAVQLLHFGVKDTGMGIAPEALQQLFHSFVQADVSTERTHGGTGLGLAISKGLVDLMGGRIWAESEAGKGSVFHFIVPLRADEDAQESDIQKPDPQLAGKRLLVIEENLTRSRTVAGFAATWGMRPHVVSSAISAAKLLATGERFDVAVLTHALDTARLNEDITRVWACKTSTILLAPLGSVVAAGPKQRVVNLPLKPLQLRKALIELFTDAAADPAQPVAPTITASVVVPMKILVVEDNVINQKVAKRMLEQLGHTPEIANSGSEALVAFDRSAFDVILMDVQMPGMNGFQTTRHIRQMEGNAQRATPIIAMTANAMLGDREKCLAAGMDEYLAKPVRPETLRAMLERFRPRPGGTETEFVRAPSGDGAAPNVEGTEGISSPPILPHPGSSTNRHSNDSLVDMERLTEFAGGSITSLIEITDLYFAQTAEQLERLREALAQRDAASLGRIAHSSAGASGVCGIGCMESLFRELEHRAKASELSDAPALLDSLASKFGEVRQILLKSRADLSLS